MAASELEINNAIRKRAPKFRQEALTLTMRIVRRLLEDDLGLAEGSLEPQKKYISTAVDRVLNEEMLPNTTSDGHTGATAQGEADKLLTTNGAPETSLESPEVEKAQAGGHKRSKPHERQEPASRSAVDSEEEDNITEPVLSGESDEEEEPSVRRKGKAGSSTAGASVGRSRKRKPASSEEEESEEATVDSEDEEEREEKAKVVARSKSNSKGSKTNGRKKSEAESDEHESEGEPGSSEDEEPAPRKRQRTGDRSSSEGGSSAESGESDEEPNHKHKSKNGKGKKAKDKSRSQASQAAYLTSERVLELKSILKQCGIMISPALYKKAKDADAEDREAVLVRGLKDLLKKEGLSSHPSDKEIKRVKQRLQTQKELEGIDTGNILEESGRGSRRAAREAAAKVPLYTDASDSDEEGGESDGEEEDEEESGGEEEEGEGEDD